MCLGLLVCLCAPSSSPAARPANPLQNVASGVVSSQGQVERLFCDAYMFNTRDGHKTETLRVVHAADRDRRFMEIIHNTSQSLPPWDDPYRNLSWCDLRKVVVYKPFGRHAFYREPSEALLNNLLYGRCIGWRQPGEIPLRHSGVGGRPFALLDVFADDQRSTLRLLAEPEVWDGLTCHVVIADGGRDRMWICPSLGYALVRRIWQSRAETGTVTETTCSEFEQVTPGLWLPKVCERQSRPGRGERASPSSFRLEVNRVAVNREVPDGVFEPQFLPGTHVFGTSGLLEKSVPGGTDLLELWVAVSVRHYPPVAPRHQELSAADMFWATLGSVLFGCGLALHSSSRQGPRPDLATGVSPASPAPVKVRAT